MANKNLSTGNFGVGTSWTPAVVSPAVQEWANKENTDWRLTPAARSKVAGGATKSTAVKRTPESSEEYTKRRIKEETKRTWRSDVADTLHGIGEGALALHPYTAIPYYGAKVGLDFLNGTYGWQTALNLSVPLFHLSPQAVGLREATNVALEDIANAGSKTARNWRIAREINLATKRGPYNISVAHPTVYRTSAKNYYDWMKGENPITTLEDPNAAFIELRSHPEGHATVAKRHLIGSNGKDITFTFDEGLNRNNLLLLEFDDSHGPSVLTLNKLLIEDAVNKGGWKGSQLAEEVKSGNTRESITFKNITPSQASQVIDFLDSNPGKDVYVHCLRGSSRSGAVDKFLEDFYGYTRPEGKNVSGASPEVYNALVKAYREKHPNPKQIWVDPIKLDESGLTSLKFFERSSRISERERLGIPKGETYYTPELNKAFLKQINDFAEKYGYPALEDKEYSSELLNSYARALIDRHNKFYRGVIFPSGEDLDLIKKTLGDKATNELILLHVATHSRGEGMSPELYITPTTNAFSYGANGRTAIISRPYKLGKDRTKWFDEGDFNIVETGTVNPKSYNDFLGIVYPWDSPRFLTYDLFLGKKTIPEYYSRLTPKEIIEGDGYYEYIPNPRIQNELVAINYPMIFRQWVENPTLETLSRKTPDVPWQLSKITVRKQGGKMNTIEFLQNGKNIRRLDSTTIEETLPDGTKRRVLSEVPLKQTYPEFAALFASRLGPSLGVAGLPSLLYKLYKHHKNNQPLMYGNFDLGKKKSFSDTLNEPTPLPIRILDALPFMKSGSKIHIKKKNRGKFTSYCGGKVTDSCIRRAKASGNPTLVKRATFAANARKWKHQSGGTLQVGAELGSILGDAMKGAIQNNKKNEAFEWFRTKYQPINWNNMKYIYKQMRLAGIPYDTTIAVMGNIVHESQGDPHKRQMGGGPGYGLLLWNKGTEPGDTLELQTKGIINSIINPTDLNNYWYHGGKGSGFSSGEDVRQYMNRKNNYEFSKKTKAFSDSLLRPGKPEMDARIKSSKSLAAMLDWFPEYLEGGKV